MSLRRSNDENRFSMKKEYRGHENSSFMGETELSDFSPSQDLKKAKEANQESEHPAVSDIDHFTIKLYKDYKISISKPLIPLKLALFCYYGAGSFMPSFMTVIYKQRGVSLSELSTMTILAPIVQFTGSAISGIIADKIGRSKPVLVFNLLLLLTVVSTILFMPKIEYENCTPHEIDLFCKDQQLETLVAKTICSLQKDKFEIHKCQARCPKNISNDCDHRNFFCNIIDGNTLLNTSSNVYVEQPYINKTSDKCIYSISAVEYENANSSWCHSTNDLNCSISCEVRPDGDCKYESFNYLIIVYSVLFVLFLTTYSNCYRCLDVTAMFLVTEHNSDFGHERFFAILGNVIISPIAGYIVEAASPPGGEKDYSIALYVFLCMDCFLFVILYKLPIRIIPPGEKMWKKSLSLMKNPDIVMFFVVILVLGTSWNFTKYFLFWYLEEMHAPSFLIGLITSVSALYGLPFLLTSKWWVRKIGPKRLIILAFLAHVVNSIGYSFLRNPWFSLVLEATGIINYYLLWVAVVEHSHNIAPEGLMSTIITVSGAIHYSIGKSTSGLTGGLIMNKFGGRTAFRFNAILCFCFAVIYASFICIRDNCSKTKEKLDQTDAVKETKEPSYILTVQNKT